MSYEIKVPFRTSNEVAVMFSAAQGWDGVSQRRLVADVVRWGLPDRLNRSSVVRSTAHFLVISFGD